MNNKLTIIVPCYNEEAVIEDTINKLSSLLQKLISEGKISDESQICFVNDGSTDNTQNIINKYTNERIACITLSSNFGHQHALMAGINTVNSSAVVTIDADLQDDYTVIEQMFTKYKEGYDVVCGVRNNRSADSFLKKTTAELFYKFMNSIGVNLIQNHADFRLLSRHAVEYLKQYKENSPFIRGIIPIIGLKRANVHYKRLPRKKGKSKYSVFKMFNFAIEGITSLSSFPLKLISFSGFIMLLISIIFLCFSIFNFSFIKLIIFLLLFSNGLILIALGIISEYIYKIHIETKKRPAYIIEKITNLK